MSANETVDDLVDKAIDQALNKVDKDTEEIKKRRPKPFRYLSPEEIKEELSKKETTFSVMKEQNAPKIVDEQLAILGLGDIDKIENVLQKHEASRKFKDK